MTTIRQQRVASLLFEELSILIGGELSDPALALTRTTGVIISRDLRNAKVFITNDDPDISTPEVLRHLKRAVPYLRGELAVRCGLRAVPDLFFVYDDTPIQAARVDDLLRQIAAERAGQSPSTPDSDQNGQPATDPNAKAGAPLDAPMESDDTQ